MDKKDWIYVLGIVVLVLVSILRIFDKITDADLIGIFVTIIAALITGTAMYAQGKLHGFKEGSATIA